MRLGWPLFARVILPRPPTQVYVKLGSLSKKLGKKSDALKYFTFAYDLDPRDSNQIKVLRSPGCPVVDFRNATAATDGPRAHRGNGLGRWQHLEIKMAQGSVR
jgi:hypothetical protein